MQSLVITMKKIIVLSLIVAFASFPLFADSGSPTGPGLQGSPENQVFQFVQEGTVKFANGDMLTAAAYLWIPERCQRLRGLLILGTNVPEHGIVGHRAIREVCAANDLGIVWSTPSFFSYKNRDERKTIPLLQELLDGLAKKSGYGEVATVPWLPMAESAHLRMIYQLLDEEPQRCIAAIFMKNMPAYSLFKNHETPVLATLGTAQEWYQDQSDIRTKWNNLSFYEAFLKQRASFPDWPASLLIEGGSGHFECTEKMVRYFADYISAAVRARLPDEPGKPLRPVAIDRGFLTGMPLPGRDDFAPLPYAEASLVRRSAAWFFDEELARRARESAAINWSAETQLPAFIDAQGNPLPMAYQGITKLTPNCNDPDGITFELKGCLLPRIPAGFVGEGAPLAAAPGSPQVEWVSGPLVALGNGKFRISLDRTWPKGLCCVVLRHPGTDRIRDVVQPAAITLPTNTAGAAQTLSFATIPDQPAGTATVPLVASSDADMPVRFFVVAGPAVVEGNHLKLLPVPPRAKFPVEIIVTAWQWGRAIAPQVQTAQPVTRTFRLLAPQ